jgi:DNA repair photolyase
MKSRELWREKRVRASKPTAVPLIVSLPKIDFWYWCRHFFDLSRGCPYGCSYCNTQRRRARKGCGCAPGNSPEGGNPLEEGFRVKTGAPLEGGLRLPPGIRLEAGLPQEKEVIGLGLLSEPFQQGDGETELVSSALRSLYDAGYPVNIVTKSGMASGISGELEILKRFARRDFIRVTFTILTTDESLSRELEGRAPLPEERFAALAALRKEGIPAGVALTPVIPRVNDREERISDLVREAKRCGASWFLFSGFDPVRSFLQDPRWKESAELHEDEERLSAYYRGLKKTLVSRLVEENLPMRIPRITLNLFRQRSSIRLVSEYLFNISYLYELMEREVEMLRYRRAAHELSRTLVPLRSLLADKKLGYVRGINPEIERVIEEVLHTEKSSLYLSLRERVAAGF